MSIKRQNEKQGMKSEEQIDLKAQLTYLTSIQFQMKR